MDDDGKLKHPPASYVAKLLLLFSHVEEIPSNKVPKAGRH